jgi:hypothetical protein
MSTQQLSKTKQKRQQAIDLRKQGLSFKEIAKTIHVSMSSLSTWLRGIELTKEQRKRLNHREHENWKLGGQRVQQLWIAKRAEIAASYNPPIHDSHFMLGLGLYWGEGMKWSESHVAMGNTSPEILRTFINWINKSFPGEFTRFRVAVQHHQGAERDLEVKKYWSQMLSIPVANFTKCHQVKPRSNRPPRRLGYGIATVRVAGKGVWMIRQKIKVALELVASMM